MEKQIPTCPLKAPSDGSGVTICPGSHGNKETQVLSNNTVPHVRLNSDELVNNRFVKLCIYFIGDLLLQSLQTFHEIDIVF